MTLVALGLVFAGTVITTNNSSFLAVEFLVRNRHVLILGVLESTNEFIALNDDVTHCAIVLIAHARAALVVQQVKGDVLAFSRGMNAHRYRH